VLNRLLQLPENKSFFLFGARGVGKSTLLRQFFPEESTLTINLLGAEEESRFSRHPEELAILARSLPSSKKRIIIDEIQKIPKLLDIVHILIEEKLPIDFIMTGSSARKLKRGGANLLAGRAFVYHLFPFSFLEMGNTFHTQEALEWGLLPAVTQYTDEEDRYQFLHAYANTYLKEEIWNEQFIKNLDPFRRFLEVAAQMNGKILNYASIARDVGVSENTVKDYFSLLEDTLIGFFLEPFHHSFRKRLRTAPKFYFFDTGVTRTLARLLRVPLRESTSLYGDTFEHLVILECIKLAHYYSLDYRFSYLSTKDDAEIDLIVDRPGLPHLFIEIKSSREVSPQSLKTLGQLSKDFKQCEAVCFSQDKYVKKYGDITVYPWQEGIKRFFLPIGIF
jgi:predicted AAA+ superfamily ATPase